MTPKSRMVSLSVFLFSAVLFFLFIMANFWHEEVYATLARFGIVVPEVTLPLLSAAVLIVLAVMLWFQTMKDERLQYEFVTIITHKFRTPLTGIRWAIEALRGDVTIEQKEDILKQMQKSNQRLLEIVDLLVGFIKLDSHFQYAYEAMSIRQLVENSLHKSAEQIRMKNITFSINTPPQLPLIIMDRGKMQFVVDMVIDNAIKYTPAGGSITVSCVHGKGKITLRITDTGIGIPSKDMKHLFQPFFRSADARVVDTEGMGLGLYTAASIVARHSGKIWAESPGRGKGSTFCIELKSEDVS